MFLLPKHPFRFGILNFNFASCDEIAARAHRVEELGYDVFLLSDHIFNFAPISGMVAAAQATTRLRVGSNVLGNDFWHPAILARELLAIDYLSNGRLEFGLGSGFYSGDYRQTGIFLDSPGVRISRLEESLSILKGLLSGETVSFSGKYYNTDQLQLSLKPVQQPHPPVLIGGGSQRVLKLAARQADIVSFNIRSTAEGGFDPTSISFEATKQKVDWVCQAAGERLPNLEFSILVNAIAVTNSQEQTEQAALQIIEDWKSAGVNFSIDDVLQSPHFLIGELGQIVDKLYQNQECLGLSYYVIFDDNLENFVPVVQRLSKS